MTENISFDLLLSDEVCRLLDCFASTMNIQVVFYSRSGKILRRGRSFGNSRYCTLMQNKFFGMERCFELDSRMQELCRKEEKALLYRCHAGLYDLIAPVKVLGEVAGFVVFGQFRIEKELPEFASGHADAAEAFEQLPCFDHEGAESLKSMINMLIGYIVDKELVSYSGSTKLQRLHCFINENFSKPVTLHQAAKFLCMSDSSLTHFLRDNHQTSFKQLLIEKRLDHAEKLWRENPALSVAEAASLSGYDDPHYFSRLYRKNRQRTARSFIDSLRNK